MKENLIDINRLKRFKVKLDNRYPILEDGIIPEKYMPSYVDDVLEFDTQASFPTTGESGKIYLTADTNKSYRWTGSGYAEISSSLALGETSATAYRGDRGKITYDHSQKSHSLTIAGNSVSALGGTLTKDTLLKSLGLSSAASDITSLKAHVADGSIHVTADDKTSWNSAVKTLDTHTKDTTIHITSDERTKWNNNIANLSTHIADSTKHITASERKAWNAKWDYNEATIKAVKVNNATTADKVGHTLTFADGTTFNGSADKSIGKAQVGLDKVENKTITVTSSSVSDGTNTFNKYTHPTHSAVTIASADGRVLGNISVDSLGHVTSVGYKALGFADLPSLYIGKTKVQNSATAQALTGISSITLEGSTAELTWDDDKSAWRLSGNLLVDGFVASGGTGSSGGSSGGAVDVSYVANLTAGTLLGTLTINGTDYQILAPSLTASSINAALGNTPVARATSDAEGNSISGTYAKTSALPTKVSQLTNDSGYLTRITKSMVEGVLKGNITSHTHSQYLTAHQSVSLASGTNNGTLKLTVGGTVTDNIEVKGLGSAAYTDSSAYAPASHTHNYAGSSSAGGAANSARTLVYINRFDINYGSYAVFQQDAGRSDLPHTGWFNTIKMLHNNSSGYFTEIATSFTGEDGMWRRALQGGTQAGWYKMLDSGNFNSYALPLNGGTLTGSVIMLGVDTNLIRNITAMGTSGWARDLITLQVDGVRKFSVGAYGSYTVGASDNGIHYGYIGCNDYDGLNLRISDTSLYWGTNPILHSSNFNSYAPKLDGTGATGDWGINISGNAATATDADTLDGVHYQNILERDNSGSSYSGTATGWFRIAETLGNDSTGCNFLLSIQRNYFYANNESYLFAISIDYYGKISITQLSGCYNEQLISKIRVDWTPGEKAYIDLYIATSTITNNYFWYTVGNAKSYTSWTANPTLNGAAYEFTTVNGCKSDKGFTGDLSGNASSATKLATTRTLWGQSFDGTKDVSGYLKGAYTVSYANDSDGYLIGHRGFYTGQAEGGLVLASSGSSPLGLFTKGTERMRITSDGDVGIGTTSPSAKLHVSGNLRASSLTLNGTNLLEWDSANSAWKFNGNLIATGFIASGDISAQAAALAEEEDRIAALEAQVAELQAEIETLKAS